VLTEHRLPSEVATPRLTLRLWTAADVDVLAAAVAESLEHLRPWMWWVADEPLDGEARRRMLTANERDWAAGGDAVYGMFERSAGGGPGTVVGGCGLHRRRGPDVLEVGYWVHAAHLGRGLATEASRGLTDAAFAQPGIVRVEIHHDRANGRSRAVPERLGFTFAGESPDTAHAPAEVGIDCAWQITAAAWSGGAAPRPRGAVGVSTGWSSASRARSRRGARRGG